MATETVGMPCLGSEGLEAVVSPHFGHCPYFTFVDYDPESGDIEQVRVVENNPHQAGGCMVPVMALINNGANHVIVGGIGMRPMMGFMQNDVNVYHGVPSESVQSNFARFVAGDFEQIQTGTCGGGRF